MSYEKIPQHFQKKAKEQDKTNINFSLFGNKYKKLYLALQSELEEYKKYASDDLNTKKELEEIIHNLENNISCYNEQLKHLKDEIAANAITLDELNADIERKKIETASLNDDLFFANFGLYAPIYNFANSEMYKDRLVIIRNMQKKLIKDDQAVTYPTYFTLDGNLKQGRAMIKDNVKQILRSFNNEADILIDKVKFNNIETIRNKIAKSYESLNKLNSRLSIAITPVYLKSKLEELNLSYEYSIKKQEEKERQKEERERLREEAKLQQEIEEARKRLGKEKTHYENAITALNKKLEKDPDNPILLSKYNELVDQLNEIKKGIEDIDYREANKRAGYVYIISNIGSFGEDVYKIGMTRRLDPMDRIRELGDASVPFNFDVHAIIFSDDAPKLENALHHAFEKNKLNMINARREFFHTKIEDIERVVRENYDKAIEFIKIPDAQQYRESLKLKQNID